MIRLRPFVLMLVLIVAGCGGGSGQEPLVVSAASSLKGAFTAYGGARFFFAGSDELAAQIRQGVKPDVYAAANTKLPDELNKDGLLSKPVEFATNELVIAVPRDSEVRDIADLAQPGLKLAIGSESVPIGSYTRDVLSR